MADCIEREKVYNIIDRMHGWCGNRIMAADLVREIRKTPAADVRPERHGKWCHLGGDEWCCSSCGYVISTEGSWEHPMSEGLCNKYCQNCGAKMDGEDGDGNENHSSHAQISK